MTATDEITFVDIPLPGAITPPPAPDSTDGGGASASDPGDSTPTGEAPYGRRADGTPREKPGRKPTNGAPKSGRTGRRAPGPAATPRPAAAKKPAGPDYAGAIMGLLQLPMAGLAMAGMRDPKWLADSVTLELHAPPLAQAAADLAKEQPAVAAALDRLMTVGPYGALLSAVVPMGLQLLANHGVLKGGTMGTHSMEDLIELATSRAGR